MKKSTVLLVALSGVLFMLILIFRPYERNYNIDEEAGIKNIIDKINDLAGNSSIYKITISTQPEQGDMDFLTINVIDQKKENHSEIKFNRSGAFFNSTDCKELGVRGKKEDFNISNLSGCLNIIEDCKKRIPHGFSYRHTEYISVNNGRVTSIKIAVAPENENNIKKDKYVHTKTYSKESYSGRKRPKKTLNVRMYYRMEFNIDKNGEITNQ